MWSIFKHFKQTNIKQFCCKKVYEQTTDEDQITIWYSSVCQYVYSLWKQEIRANAHETRENL